MSKIFLNRNRESLGQFTPEDIAAGLKSGKFFPTDLAWREGMATWQPLSTLTDITDMALSLEAPSATSEPPPITPDEDFPPLPSWEQKEQIGIVPALKQSIGQIILNPVQTFSRMKQDRGLWRPLSFLLILGVPSTICGLIWLLVLQLVGMGMPANETMLGGYSQKSVMFGVIIVEAILTPILIPIGAFICAGIFHLFLMMTGGANKSFETTFRVHCYVNGAFSIFQIILGGMYLIPFVGMLIAFAYSIGILGVFCVGLKEAHRTDLWRVILAVLIPIVLCCGLIALGLIVPALAAASNLHH